MVFVWLCFGFCFAHMHFGYFIVGLKLAGIKFCARTWYALVEKSYAFFSSFFFAKHYELTTNCIPLKSVSNDNLLLYWFVPLMRLTLSFENKLANVPLNEWSNAFLCFSAWIKSVEPLPANDIAKTIIVHEIHKKNSDWMCLIIKWTTSIDLEISDSECLEAFSGGWFYFCIIKSFLACIVEKMMCSFSFRMCAY